MIAMFDQKEPSLRSLASGKAQTETPCYAEVSDFRDRHLLPKSAVDVMSAFFPDSESVEVKGGQPNPSYGLAHDWSVPASDLAA
jgi:hypothetical protein